MFLRIDDAIARARRNGLKVQKKDIAAKLWPNTSEAGQRVNMTNLCTGRCKRIEAEWVSIICSMLDCDANYLFGLTL